MLSETTGPAEAKLHVASPWYSCKHGKLIQMIKVICCYSSLSTPGRGHLAEILPHILPYSAGLFAGLLCSQRITFLRGLQMTGALINFVS